VYAFHHSHPRSGPFHWHLRLRTHPHRNVSAPCKSALAFFQRLEPGFVTINCHKGIVESPASTASSPAPHGLTLCKDHHPPIRGTPRFRRRCKPLPAPPSPRIAHSTKSQMPSITCAIGVVLGRQAHQRDKRPPLFGSQNIPSGIGAFLRACCAHLAVASLLFIKLPSLQSLWRMHRHWAGLCACFLMTKNIAGLTD